MKTKNIKEAKELVRRYETITLEEIKKNFDPGELTGFGQAMKCTLCLAVDDGCDGCIYAPGNCIGDKNEKTYFRIWDANTPIKLRNAYRARAVHIKSILIRIDS